jgi:hypothetical protein
MSDDSVFLRNLLGKRVRIVAVDEEDLPPLTLREVSSLGVVAEDSTGPHFYPWTEIVEIRMKGFWAVTVRANWRVIFRLDGDAEDVDYVDYH